MIDYLYFKRYRLSSSIARDTVVKDCIPIGHVVQCILLRNAKNSSVTIDFNINDDSTIPEVEIPAYGYAFIEPNDRYYATKNAFVEITSNDWNGARLSIDIILWEV